MYHIMFRGNNKSTIFYDDEDRRTMVTYLEELPIQYDSDGRILPSLNCTFYAYCLMSNHVHLLYREMGEDAEHSMKRLLTRYARYYNLKYGRVGHVFQDRFRSEPCNDMAYFVTLLRYIHQNPVKAGIAERVDEYPWSSWSEYANFSGSLTEEDIPMYTHVCNVRAVLKRFSYVELSALVNDTLPDDVGCLDDDQDIRKRQSDEDLKGYMREACHLVSASDIEHLPQLQQQKLIRDLYEHGATYRQIARLTSFSYRQVYKVINNSRD